MHDGAAAAAAAAAAGAAAAHGTALEPGTRHRMHLIARQLRRDGCQCCTTSAAAGAVRGIGCTGQLHRKHTTNAT
eukprot:2680470-Alexandrium_andersonii.AAC.1